MIRPTIVVHASLCLVLLAGSAVLHAQEKSTPSKHDTDGQPTVIWRDPGDVSTLNLLYGAGGAADAPDPSGVYTFVTEDPAGHSPKFEVTDAQGVRWAVKLGEEPQSETAASRLLWAAGYFTDEDYYLAELKVTGLPTLHRGQAFVSGGNVVRHVRLKRHSKGVKKLGNWDWFENPFTQTRELNGLRVMMALLNNWDLRTINNAVDEVGGERHYLASDVGATFGKTGNILTRSKSVLHDYAAAKFVDGTTADTVDLVMHSRPFFLSLFDVWYYRERVRMERVTRHIPRADAKWLGQRLALLSADQLRDGFRAGGYTPQEVEGFTQVVQQRIAQLNAL